MTTREEGEVIIFRMFGEEAEQGREVARVQTSTYKWAPRNAINRWVRETHPDAGQYAAVFPEGYNYGNGRGAVMNLYTVTYPEAVVTCNRDEEKL